MAVTGLCLAETSGPGMAGATLARTPQAPRAYVPAPATDGPAKGAIYVDDMDGANDTVALKARGYLPYYRGTGPQGVTATWYQGNTSVFLAYNGPDSGYVAANYNVVTGQNNIDSWLVLPAISGGIRQGDSLYFYSRSTLNSTYPDSIRVMYSVSDTLPEGSWIELGRFKAAIDGNWELRGFEAPITAAKGRFAIRYCVINGGPSGSNSNYIGIDAISVVTHQDSLEYIGGTDQVYSGAPRMRGNFFLCDVNTIVKEYRWFIDPADTLNLWFAIYEGDSAGGTFDLKSSRMVRTPDTAAGWFTTGPMDTRMEAGKYYFFAMVWDASVSAAYYRSASGTTPYPYPYSFGDLVGVCGLSPYGSGTPITPPQDTLEVPAGVFTTSGDLAYYQALVTVPELRDPILVFEETPGDTSHYYQQAAANLGFNTVLTLNWPDFLDSLYGGTPWTMALVNNFNNSPTTGQLDSVNSYLTGGGKLVFYTWAFYNNPSHPLYANLGASYIGDLTVPVNVHANNPADALFTTPNTVTSLYWTDDIWTVDCTRMAPTGGGTAVAYLEGYPGETALIANAGQTALFNSFESTCYNADSDMDGKLDIVELIENEITWLLSPIHIGVEGSPQELKAGALMLAPNRPNPFRGSTSIEFQLPKAGKASLKVYNILGQAVATLVDGELAAGRHQVAFNARGLANGIYLYRLEAGGQRLTRKLAVIK